MSQEGRIGGPLLAQDLLRNGTDLSFDTSLLYLNVGSKYLGINTQGPSSELTIGTVKNNGGTTSSTISTINLIVSTTANIGNFTITGSTIQHLTSGITVAPNQAINPTIVTPGLSTNNLYISNNTVTTTVTNDNINITPNGNNGAITSIVAAVSVSAIYNITLPVVQSGGTNATIYFDPGSVIGGNAVIVTAGKGYIPGLATVTYNSITYNLNITTVVTNGGNINFANDAGNVSVTVNAGLHATGNITFDGNIQLGNSTSDVVTFVAKVNSDLLPVATEYLTMPNANRLLSQNGPIFVGLDDEALLYIKPNAPLYSYTPLYDLGSASLKWNNLRANSFSSDSSLVTSITASTANIANYTFTGNTINNQLYDIIFNPSGTGRVTFNSTQYVNGNNIVQNTSNGAFTLNSTGFGYIKFSGTSGTVFPVGTSGNRPASPATGTMRYNSDIGYGELWNGTTWIPVGGASLVLSPAEVVDVNYAWDLILG